MKQKNMDRRGLNNELAIKRKNMENILKRSKMFFYCMFTNRIKV